MSIQNKLIRDEEIKRKRGKGNRIIRYYECANIDCNNTIRVEPREYNFKNNTNADMWMGCCSKCSHSNYVQTHLRKIENPFSNRHIKEKIKATNLERYGSENPFGSDIIKEKIKATNLERYGSEYPQRSIIIQNKTINTNLKKYGVKYSWCAESVKEKIKATNLERYGSEHYFSSEKFYMIFPMKDLLINMARN